MKDLFVNMTDVIVEITQGKLCGRIAKDANGNDYKSFQGIPYAEPPIGELRFKAPKPAEKWKEDILDATKVRSVCPAVFSLPGCDSSEDCLFLNVYTPQLPNESQSKLPVMVWIHGGAFIMGSGNPETFGPEYLVAKNVVLVTLNYRLGYLGFLKLNDPSCEVYGNAALKDQTEALRWVQKNISAFGGDPNNVTLFGESAGSCCVSLHLLSSLSKGLFHKAILQSGVALNTWAIQVRRDYDFVRLLGCTSTYDKEILTFLQKQKIEDILNAQMLANSAEVQKSCGELCQISPSIEINNPSAFLTESPEKLLEKGLINDVPIIIGTTDSEGLLSIIPLFKDFTIYLIEKDVLLPRDLLEKLKTKDQIEKTTKKIKEFYNFHDFDSTIDFWTDLAFTHKTQFLARKIASKSKHSVYNYLFRISIDEMKTACTDFNVDLYKGAAHAEELGYLFKSSLKSIPSPDTPIGIGVHIMSTLWTNFAKTGNPNPTKSDPYVNVEWKPFTINDENYLEIDSKLQLNKNLSHERVQFWDNLYK